MFIILNRDLIRKIRRKEDKTETEELVCDFYECFFYVSEILVEESKLHIDSEEAILLIREHMNKNL